MAADLSSISVEALTWSGSNWVIYTGTGDANGNFSIPGVPNGDFMVDVGGSIYAYTSERTLDLGFELSGRPSGVAQTTANTIGGAVTNLQPWSEGDFITWYDPNAAGAGYDGPTPEPATGATSLTSSEVSTWQGDLIDGSQGDVLYLTQLNAAGVSASASTYTVTRFLSLAGTGVKQVDGTPFVANGALTTVAASQTLAIDFRASQFLSLASDVSPGGSAGGAFYQVLTQPGAATAGAFGYTTTVYELYATADTDLGSASFGNPFNGSWGLVSEAGISVPVTYTAPGATSSNTLYGSVYITYPAASLSGPVVPTLSPVTSPVINGTSLWTAQSGVGVTPTLSWSAPTTGTPSEYFVTIYQLVASGSATAIDYVQQIATTTTSVTIPPGQLTKGDAYVFVITAHTSPLDGGSKPYRWSPNVASADALSAIISP